MSRFITGNSTLTQVKKKYFKLDDNELYIDSNGDFLLCPRNFLTDNYTIPFGNRVAEDVRPSHFHDLFCRYHRKIKVVKPIQELQDLGILHITNNEVICNDIPIEFLEITNKITRKDANDTFLRMMKATHNISNFKMFIYRIGVALNLNWWLKGSRPLKQEMIYVAL